MGFFWAVLRYVIGVLLGRAKDVKRVLLGRAMVRRVGTLWPR